MRRAWIEIILIKFDSPVEVVALREEGVDRNGTTDYKALSEEKSPSVRRAWIEMEVNLDRSHLETVALREEGVDRNVLQAYCKL